MPLLELLPLLLLTYRVYCREMFVPCIFPVGGLRTAQPVEPGWGVD